MNEPIRDLNPGRARGRKLIAGLILGSVVLLSTTSTSSQAGAIRHTKAHTRTASVAAANYWQDALLHHRLRVHGPRALSVLALSADGTLPDTPFAEYMLWRQSLSVKRFDSFHPEVARMLRKIKITTLPPTIPPPPGTPGQSYPPGTNVPILPPDFTPLTPVEQIVPPPQVPEPSTGLMALVMIGGAIAARRWATRRGG